MGSEELYQQSGNQRLEEAVVMKPDVNSYSLSMCIYICVCVCVCVCVYIYICIYIINIVVVVIQLLSVQLFVIPCIEACQAPLSSTISQSLLEFMSIESVMLSNHLILCHPFFLLSSIFSSGRVFSKESALRIRWPKYWSFSFSINLRK